MLIFPLFPEGYHIVRDVMPDEKKLFRTTETTNYPKIPERMILTINIFPIKSKPE
jgi:hypothetical protein